MLKHRYLFETASLTPFSVAHRAIENGARANGLAPMD
jgi:hypothetical protein